MANQKATPPGKMRTRQHIIADLAVNHLERYVLLCGHTVERVWYDYGYDAVASTLDEDGQVEGGLIFFQVKATDELPILKDGKSITWTVNRRDLKLWLREAYPVVLIVYDAYGDKAYWLDVQESIASRPRAELFAAGHMMQVHIPLADRVNRRSITAIVRQKRTVHQQLEQRDNDHE